MSKVLVACAVAVGLAVATFTGLWSSHSASAQQIEVSNLKCYKVQRVDSKTLRTNLIYIRDQFEEKNLIIKKPITFCNLADKGGLGGSPAGLPNEPSDLVCYSFSYAPNQERFHGTTVIAGDQFGENFLQITKPYSLCEPAEKEIVPSGSAAGFDNELFDAFEFMCYRVRRLENGERFQKISVRLFDQFGSKDARLGAPILFCTQVEEKKNKAKNNHIEHAAVVESGSEYHASTISTSSDRSDPPMSCAPSYGHSVYFTFNPNASGEHSFDTSFSTYNTAMAIYEAGDPLHEIACDDNGGLTSGSSRIEVNLQSDRKYIIVVGSYGGGPGGKLKLAVDLAEGCGSAVVAVQCAGTTAAEAADSNGDVAGPLEPVESIRSYVCYALSQRAPAIGQLGTRDQLALNFIRLGRGNMFCTPAVKKTFATTDDIHDAGTLTPLEEVHAITTNATSDPSDPDCAGYTYGHSVWYTYDFPGNDKSFDVDTFGSTYDTILGVYTGTPGNLQQVGCNDDDVGSTSHLNIETKAGAQTYYILVAAYGDNDAGKLKLHIETQAGCAACP